MIKNIKRGILAFTLLLAAQAPAKAEEILLQSAQSGLYVTMVNGTFAAATRHVSRATRLDTVRLDGGKMAFRDIGTGKYVRAGIGSNTLVGPASPHIRSWEIFDVLSMGEGKIALRSTQNNLFVRAGVGQRSHLAAVSSRAAGWEMFRFVNQRQSAGNPQNANQGSGLNQDDLSGNFRITHVAANNGFLVQLGQQLAGKARLQINGGNVHATLGCNSMSTQIAVRQGQIRSSGSVIATKMMCQGQGQMAAERGVSNALVESHNITRQGRIFILSARNGAVLMKLRKL